MARNILIRLTGDPDDAKDALDEILQKLKELPDEVSLEITVEADEAKKDLDDLEARMEVLPKDELIRIQIDADETKLDLLMAKLAALKAAQDEMNASGNESGASALGVRMGDVASRIQSVTTHLERARTQLDQFGEEGAQALSPFDKAILDLRTHTDELGNDIERSLSPYEKALRSLLTDTDALAEDGGRDVSRLTGNFTRLGTGIGHVRTGLVSLVSNIVGKIPLLGGVFSKVTDTVGKLAENLLPDAAQGFAGMLAQGVALAAVVPILLAIAAAAAALVVSLGEALIGIIALGVAFLVALGPIALLLGVVAEKIKDIVSGQTTLTSAVANLKTAYQSVKEAVTSLHQAETAESVQRIAALQAERQAVLAVQQAENQVAQDKLGVQQAALNLAEARTQLALFNQELAGVGSSPGNLQAATQNVMTGGNMGQTQAGASSAAWQAQLEEYASLVLGVKGALIGQGTASLQLKSDQIALQGSQVTLSQYQKIGLRAYGPYQTAVNETKTATQNLTKAIDELKSAEIEKNQAIKHGADEAAGFEAAWKKLKATFETILGPGVAAIFKGIEKSMGIMAGHGKTLTPAFTKLGIAIGNAFVWWAKMISKPGNLALIKQLIGDSAGLVKQMSHWLGGVFKLLTEVGVTSLPKLLKMIGHWASQLAGINGQHKTIKDFIDKCIASATTWWHRLLKIGDAVISVANSLKSIINIAKEILKPFEALGKLLGIGAGGGGIIGGIALLAGGKGLLKVAGSGIGALFKGGGAGAAEEGGLGLSDILGPALLAGGAGYGIGTEINHLTGASGAIDNLLGINTKTQAQQEAQANADALKPNAEQVTGWEKALASGLYQSGPNTGKEITAAFQKFLEDSLGSVGVHYAGPIATPAGAPTQHIEHFHAHFNQGDTVGDAHHFAAVLKRRVHTTGSSVK